MSPPQGDFFIDRLHTVPILLGISHFWLEGRVDLVEYYVRSKIDRVMTARFNESLKLQIQLK